MMITTLEFKSLTFDGLVAEFKSHLKDMGFESEIDRLQLLAPGDYMGKAVCDCRQEHSHDLAPEVIIKQLGTDE